MPNLSVLSAWFHTRIHEYLIIVFNVWISTDVFAFLLSVSRTNKEFQGQSIYTRIFETICSNISKHLNQCYSDTCISIACKYHRELTCLKRNYIGIYLHIWCCWRPSGTVRFLRSNLLIGMLTQWPICCSMTIWQDIANPELESYKPLPPLRKGVPNRWPANLKQLCWIFSCLLVACFACLYIVSQNMTDFISFHNFGRIEISSVNNWTGFLQSAARPKWTSGGHSSNNQK